MGTSFEIYLYAADREQATQLFDEAFEEIERLESLLSNYRDSSELSRINKRAAHEQVVTDPEMFHFLEQSLAWSRRTEGAFDITVGGLMRAWGFFRGRGKLPTDAELIAVRAHTGWRHVLLSHATRSIRFDAANVELDSGGNGKGYAVDAVAQILRVRDVRAALVVAGSSSIYAIGSPPGKSGWTINIPDPMNRARTIQPVLLQDKALTTSGSYEKFFRIGERTYCHIMDPRTGRPVEGILQTTIIAPTATEGEVLSKATFVLGAIDGKRLLETLGQNYAGLLVTDKQGAGRIVRIRL
jgi:thiamine biosynthesis lipoprotein